MSKLCELTGKGPRVGNSVSHSKRRVRRRFMPNLHTGRYWLESEKRYIKLKLSSSGRRLIDKIGLEEALRRMKARSS